MNQTKKLSPAIAALIVIVLVGIVASVAIVVKNNGGNALTTQNQTTDPVASASSTDTSTYKDGTYQATGTYVTPEGRETIQLTVTIKDGVIQDTSIDNSASNRESEQYQTRFKSNYKTLVVGKKLTEVGSLSRVAGSSLTSNGFNNALDEIKSNAKA